MFQTRDDHRRHERLHKFPGGFQCSACDGVFLNSLECVQHMKSVHKVNIPFLINRRKKSFVSIHRYHRLIGILVSIVALFLNKTPICGMLYLFDKAEMVLKVV